MNKETSKILKRIKSDHRRIAQALFELEKSLEGPALLKPQPEASDVLAPRKTLREKIATVEQLQAALLAGSSLNQAASELGVPVSTASRWLRSYRHVGRRGLLAKKSPGRPKKQKEARS